MSWIKNIPIAHRGLHNDSIPENSILSFEEAISNDYAIELDVHLSNDGELIVFHDRNLKRMTGINEIIEAQSSEFLTSLQLLNSKEKIPTLTEVLKIVNNRGPILIEIKNQLTDGKLEEKLNIILSKYKGEYAIQSFNPYSVGWFAKNNPSILRGQLSGDFKNENLPNYKKIMMRYFLMNWYSKPNFIAYDINLLPCWAVSIQKKLGIPILAWTIDTKVKKEKAMKYADNIIFEGIKV